MHHEVYEIFFSDFDDAFIGAVSKTTKIYNWCLTYMMGVSHK